MCEEYIIENSSMGKRFKCPYCEVRLERNKLISHIEDIHEDMIPEGYSATRLVFNLINKKDHGNCVTCGRTTPWNEDLARYERFCIDNNGKCKQKAADLAELNMINARGYGRKEFLGNDEQQKLMLANRSISGTYKFSTGGSATYTGTYEEKLLKFLDKIHYRAIDIMTPGPSIEYEFEGKPHTWITDVYLIPYNLVFDVKDGGDNPNNREMPEYRAKQDAKEAAITKLNKYNYIRLTDNNFAQLLYILAELKEQLMDDDNTAEHIIRINENTSLSINENCIVGNTNHYDSIDEYSSAVMGAMVGGRSPIYVVPYMKNNSFTTEYGVSDSETLDSIFTTDDEGNISVKSNKFLKEECEVFTVYKFIKQDELNKLKNPSNLVEALTGKKILDANQLLFDTDFEQIIPFNKVLDMAQDTFMASLKGTTYEIPVVGESCLYDNIAHYQDINGYFIKNENTNIRSKSFSSINKLSKKLQEFISESKL
jgi:hypothetical protein